MAPRSADIAQSFGPTYLLGGRSPGPPAGRRNPARAWILTTHPMMHSSWDSAYCISMLLRDIVSLYSYMKGMALWKYDFCGCGGWTSVPSSCTQSRWIDRKPSYGVAFASVILFLFPFFRFFFGGVLSIHHTS